MRQQSKEYIVILFVVAALALNYPFLDLFDRLLLPLGIPLLYFYLYLVWFVIILLLAVVVEHSEQRDPEQSLPLSEPQPETLGDGRLYTVQWFERARFELHPENKPPYNVLLGLLGNELRAALAPQPTAAPAAYPAPPTPTSRPGGAYPAPED